MNFFQEMKQLLQAKDKELGDTLRQLKVCTVNKMSDAYLLLSIQVYQNTKIAKLKYSQLIKQLVITSQTLSLYEDLAT